MHLIAELKSVMRGLLARTPMQYLPVRVRKGLARGAKWTLFPYSANWRGHTEMDIEAAILHHGSLRGRVCWDLGAHFGIYTVGMAFAVGQEGHVYGFEPDPVSFARCRRHVRMNKLDWVTIFNLAVSDSDGARELLVGPNLGAATSHFAYEDEHQNPDERKVQVNLTTLDSLVESGEILPPDFIKVDVEGHGAKALKGAQRTIAAHLPTMVMSFHSLWERDGTRELLDPLGYRAYGSAGMEMDWDATLYRTVVLRSRRTEERVHFGSDVAGSNSHEAGRNAS